MESGISLRNAKSSRYSAISVFASTLHRLMRKCLCSRIKTIRIALISVAMEPTFGVVIVLRHLEERMILVMD